MTETDKKSPPRPRITEQQRFHYIGFEVFPGKPKDLFKNDAEKKKYIADIAAKRERGEVLREHCTLLEERVSLIERLVLTVASLAIFVSLFLPWYSVYNEVVDSAKTAETTDMAAANVPDSLQALLAGDSLAGVAGTTETAEGVAPESVEPTGEPAAVGAAAEEESAGDGRELQTHAGQSSREEIITGHQFKKARRKEYTRLSGFGTFGSLGSVGSYVFSSGFILVLSGILMIIYAALCIVLPVFNIYGIYGMKGKPDEVAMKLKRMLRFNWLPLILLVVLLFLSFFGADYGFEVGNTFASIGDSYGPGVFLGSLSWGIFLAMAASIVVAVKAVEI